jgi:hypothetical protein
MSRGTRGIRLPQGTAVHPSWEVKADLLKVVFRGSGASALGGEMFADHDDHDPDWS